MIDRWWVWRCLCAGMAVIALLGQSSAGAAAPEKRVALVIGNGAYRNAPTLKNSVNDAKLMAEAFSALGFRLIGDGPLTDIERPAMEQAIRAFGKALREGAVGVFYYSGHGLQVKGINYMAPVSAKVASESDVKYELVDVGFVLDEMGNAGNRLNIVILDACRNNPLSTSGVRSVGDGLATMTAPAGTAIAFATQPGNVARDGIGSHSPYTEALVKAIRTPGLDLFDTFNEVGLAVKRATDGRQQPWLSSSPIEGRFYFAGLGQGDLHHPDNAPDVARAKAEVERLKREAEDAKAVIERANAQAVELRRRQGDEDARAAARRRQAEADVIDELRSCRDEALSNHAASDRLKDQVRQLESGWNSLQDEKARLDDAVASVNANRQFAPVFLEQMARTQNQEYNSHRRELEASKVEYYANKNDLTSKLASYNKRCQKGWSRSAWEEVCGSSDDSFCSRQ